tara:strand:+ start:2569 stop:2682 length:114 start_codon:yes stop_codon:yes gene_type:complete
MNFRHLINRIRAARQIAVSSMRNVDPVNGAVAKDEAA